MLTILTGTSNPKASINLPRPLRALNLFLQEDPKLWYGIGTLHRDRYGSLDHAEEAFFAWTRVYLGFGEANEILFRLGIIYKQQSKYDESLGYFDCILRNPPLTKPLAHADIWFQIGHVYEQQKDRYPAGMSKLGIPTSEMPPIIPHTPRYYGSLVGCIIKMVPLSKTKILPSNIGQRVSKPMHEVGICLGAYVAGQKYDGACGAYQQAVYCDGRNPTFWCSIGVLYFQINQFHDALDAYSRAIRINPYISEV
ncbi:hypothetical protein BD779DRAFT_1680060 [Infundibulicybe gibba]|nr:hypothetical protein BD779DRAFT_1680060 [Infundibulicybe gibba]